jgi:hypothetical protein
MKPIFDWEHEMNGENNHIFHTSAMDNADTRPYVWGLFAVQLWVLAGFTGLSLIAIAAQELFENVGNDGLIAPLLGFTGVAFVLTAWQKASRLLRRTETELDSSAGDADQAPRISVKIRPAHAHARMTGITPTL